MTRAPNERLILEAGEVDLAERQAWVGGDPVQLSGLEVRLLAYLALRPEVAVPRDELLREVWGYAGAHSRRAVDASVWRLRRKLERDPNQPRHLLTSHGEGYLFVPLQRPAAARSTAPLRPGPLVGRDELVARVREALDGRVVTLIGTPGVGKSRLALEMAYDQSCHAFIALEGPDTEEALDAAVLRGLGGAVEGIRRARGLRERVGSVAGALGPGLLVLDGAEHVPESLRAALPEWVSAAPELRVLLTAYGPIGVVSERAMPVPPLPLRDAVSLLCASAERHGAAPPSVEAGLALARRLDGLPLALELAGAHLALRSPDDLLQDLERDLSTLRPIHAGQRGLQAALAGAWSRLSSGARDLVVVASQLGGPAPRRLLVRIDPNADEHIAEAAQVGLLRREAGSTTRYGLLDAVRGFALAHGEPHDEARLLAAILAELRREPDPDLAGAALALGPEAPERAELTLTLATHLRRTEPVHRRLALLTDAIQPDLDPDLATSLQVHLCDAHLDDHDPHAALAAADAAVSAARDPDRRSVALGRLARAQLAAGQALDCLHSARASRDAGPADPIQATVARADALLAGLIAGDIDDDQPLLTLATCVQRLLDAGEGYEGLRMAEAEVIVLANLGQTAAAQRARARLVTYALRGRGAAPVIGHRHAAHHAWQDGRWSEALALTQRGRRAAVERGLTSRAQELEAFEARYRLHLGELEACEVIARRLLVADHDPAARSEGLAFLGLVALYTGAFGEAVDRLLEARAVGGPTRRLVLDSHLAFATIAAVLGGDARAPDLLATLGRRAEDRPERFDATRVAIPRLVLAVLALRRGDPEQARAHAAGLEGLAARCARYADALPQWLRTLAEGDVESVMREIERPDPRADPPRSPVDLDHRIRLLRWAEEP